VEQSDLQYEPLRANEQNLGKSLAYGLMTDEDILAQIEDYHDSDTRCAAVFVLENGEFSTGYVGGEDAIRERFPFFQVQEALDTYTPGEMLCMIIQRDNLVSVGILGTSACGPEVGLN